MLTQAQMDARQATEGSINGLVFRCKELHSLYTMFSVQYQAMDATARRFMAITAPTTDQKVRQVVYAKFLLAAILEWAPNNHNFSVSSFVAQQGPTYKIDQLNELCPYWESFFDDVHEAVAALEKLISEPKHAFDADGPELIQQITSLVESAEMKMGWTESLLKLVAASTSIKGFKPPTSEAETYRTWNQFCLSISNGMSVTDACLRFRESGNSLHRYRLPDPLTQATGQRIWFAFDMDAEPWLAHAQAILQQPHHLVPARPSEGMYAHDAEPWRLEKTTDLRTNHWHCSLGSPCCLGPHIHCAGTSPCRNWGPSMCVHVRAGVDRCEDPHCKMVDWMKYNLCVPPANAMAAAQFASQKATSFFSG